MGMIYSIGTIDVRNGLLSVCALSVRSEIKCYLCSIRKILFEEKRRESINKYWNNVIVVPLEPI